MQLCQELVAVLLKKYQSVLSHHGRAVIGADNLCYMNVLKY